MYVAAVASGWAAALCKECIHTKGSVFTVKTDPFVCMRDKVYFEPMGG